jgi:hypothetical protein
VNALRLLIWKLGPWSIPVLGLVFAALFAMCATAIGACGPASQGMRPALVRPETYVSERFGQCGYLGARRGAVEVTAHVCARVLDAGGSDASGE